MKHHKLRFGPRKVWKTRMGKFRNEGTVASSAAQLGQLRLSTVSSQSARKGLIGQSKHE